MKGAVATSSVDKDVLACQVIGPHQNDDDDDDWHDRQWLHAQMTVEHKLDG